MATVDAGGPVKKSLRSKRLMRPGSTAKPSETAPPPIPEVIKNTSTEAIDNDTASDLAVADAADMPVADTDTDTLKTTGKTVDAGGSEDEFVEAVSQTSSRHASPRVGGGGRPRLDSSFGGKPSSLLAHEEPQLESIDLGASAAEAPTLFDFEQSDFGTTTDESRTFGMAKESVLGDIVEEPNAYTSAVTMEEPGTLGVTIDGPDTFISGATENMFNFERLDLEPVVAGESNMFDFGVTATEEASMFVVSPEAATQSTAHSISDESQEADADADNLIQLLSSTSEKRDIPADIPIETRDIPAKALDIPVEETPSDTIPSEVQTMGDDSGRKGGAALGRSISLRYGGSAAATGGERRRPSLSTAKASNRRSIMLTSFVPPVGMSGGPSSSTSTRSSDDSHGDQPSGDSDQPKSRSPDVASIRLRPSADVGQVSVAKAALASISERIGGSGEAGGPPAWVLEVQRRKQEAQEKEEEMRVVAPAPVETHIDEDDDLPLTEIALSPAKEDNDSRNKPLPTSPPPAAYVAQAAAVGTGAQSRSIYRSLSASLGIGQPVEANAVVENERQRSTSQASMATASPTPAQGGGLFAAVTSFFGRTSTQASSAAESAQLAAVASRESSSSISQSPGKIAFPGMRPSHSEAVIPEEVDEVDSLLHQLEAQNAQILGDTKARVFAAPAEDAPPADEAAADWDFWGTLISDYDRVSRTSPRKLARAVHAGIPAPIRGTVWQLMSGSRADAELVGAAFRRLQRQAFDTEEQRRHDKLIRQDVARTFPRDAYFRDAGGAGQEGLYAVLRAYSLYDADVGYCQGLAFVVGPLLLHMPDEEAFCVLVRLMAAYGLRGHFLPAMDDLHLRLFQFDHVLHATLPRLAKHLDQQGVKPTMYASQWLMTLFAYRLPLHLAVRLFDVVFAEGLDALLRVALAVLKRSQPRLLALEFEAIVHYLNDGPLFAFYAHAAPDTLVRDANQITAVTPRLLQTLRRKYVEEAERRMDEEDEMARLRAECEMLKRDKQQMLLQMQNGGGEDLERLAQKNVQLALKNQQLEDSLHDMEAALVQIKVLYAESESDRAVLAMKLDGLRKALT